MFSAFFIRRPIFAIVISLVILIVGSVSISRLPIEQFPTLAPPTIRVTGTYQGAGAEVVEQSVATPLEQKINGVDNMLSMLSKNTSDGAMTLDVNFEVGMDLDFANMLTQNRVQQAQARLPQEVIQTGVTVAKINPSILMVVSVYSESGQYDDIFLNNFAMINVRDQLLRVKGVSTVDLIGAEYSMRVWFKPDVLAKMGMTPPDVINAIKEQNIQAPAGKIGDAPSASDQEFTFTVRAPGRLQTPEEFEQIIVRETPDGRVVRVGDVARVELGNEFYKSRGRWNGKPAAALVVYLLPGANQLEAAEGIYETLDEIQQTFPEDIKTVVGYDTTPAVEASIEEILHTLVEAIILVLLVVFVFLQNWRATLIPLLTIPVSLIGTFAIFPLLGFSINTLSL
ncbi:MAG: hydrophobe/amphiphile efflux-1 family RND transporter, partial [Ignavibacteriae bacterium]